MISEKEAKATANKLCKECRHTKADHIFWDADKVSLKVTNCNICSCEEFKE